MRQDIVDAFLGGERVKSIAKRLSVSRSTVGRTLNAAGIARREGNVAWTEPEDAILYKLFPAEDDVISAALCEAGFNRTAKAIGRHRTDLGLYRAKPDQLVAMARGLESSNLRQKGWPVMHGDAEERDDRFWRKVLRAGGLPTIEIGKGWVYPSKLDAWRSRSPRATQDRQEDAA